MALKASITKGLNPEQEAIVRDSFNSSATIRKRLIEIFTEKINSSRVSVRSKDNYALANWAYSIADQIGYERAYAEAIALITSESVE